MAPKRETTDQQRFCVLITQLVEVFTCIEAYPSVFEGTKDFLAHSYVGSPRGLVVELNERMNDVVNDISDRVGVLESNCLVQYSSGIQLANHGYALHLSNSVARSSRNIPLEYTSEKSQALHNVLQKQYDELYEGLTTFFITFSRDQEQASTGNHSAGAFVKSKQSLQSLLARIVGMSNDFPRAFAGVLTTTQKDDLQRCVKEIRVMR